MKGSCVQLITLFCIVGFQNYYIVGFQNYMARQSVAHKDHVTSVEVKITI